MAVRRDSVQLDVSIITDESKQYAKLINDNKAFIKELEKAKKKGEDVSAVVKDIAESGRKIAGIDLSKLTPSQLISRAKQLGQAMRQIPQSSKEYAELEGELKAINDQLAEMRKRTRGVAAAQVEMMQEGSRAGKILNTVFAVFGGITLAGIFDKIVGIGRQMIEVSATTQKFAAVLTNALGSESEAQRALDMLQKFAAETPFQLEEVTGSYIKLVNRGIKPTQEELVKLGDLAASQGKSFDQLVEAILDAQTGEFERLKEFGIRASKENDRVTLSFKNQTVEVANNEKAIKNAILAYGELNGVQGTMRAIAETTGGALSNMADNAFRLLNALGEKTGIASVIKNLSRGFGELTNFIAGTNDKVVSAVDEVTNLQAAFNSEIAVLKTANFTQDERNKLIGEINSKYGDYLGNLIEENASIEDIEKAQRRANQAFKERIILISFQEKIADLTKQAAENATIAFEAEKERARLSNRNFSDFEKAILEGPSGAGRDAVLQQEQFFEGLRKGALDNINEINKEIEEVPEIFDSLAKEIGTTLDAIFKRFETNTKSKDEVVKESTENVRAAIAELQAINSEVPDLTGLQVGDITDRAEERRNDFLKDLLKEREEIFKDYEERRLANEKRLQDLRFKANQSELQLASDSFQFLIDLLGKDEAARKKHANAIKALEIFQVQVKLAAEIQGIWKNANENPINALIPGWGPTFAALQTGLAVGRAALQTRNISKAKYARGGYTGEGYGMPDETGFKPAGWVHEGEWVGPKWMVERFGGLFSQLEGIRQRGFAQGGYTSVNTTPSGVNFSPTVNATAEVDLSSLQNEFQLMRRDMRSMQRNLKAYVVLSDIESASDEMNSVRNEAAL